MSTRLACRIARLVLYVVPAPQRDWARAMASEIACIEDDAQALVFALGCLRVGCALALVGRLGQALADCGSWMAPHRLGLACASAATLIGCAGMVTLGMPGRYPIVQGLSLLVGLCALPLLARTRLPAGAFVFCAGCAIALTAVFGLSSGGVTRWVAVGPLRLQPSLILLPPMLVLLARERSPLACLGIALAALALARQADLALSSALLFASLPALARMPGARRLALLALMGCCWAWTLSRPAAPVDSVIAAGFAASGLLGILLYGGLCLLLVPALAAPRQPAHLAFGTCWLAVLVSSLAGLSTTPLLGFGGSAVLGYLFSVASLNAGRPSTEPQ